MKAQLALLKSQAYMNGEWVNSTSSKVQDIFNPASGELIGTVPFMGREEAKAAINAANAALPGWRALTAKERSINRLRKYPTGAASLLTQGLVFR